MKLTTDEASRGLFATAELLVLLGMCVCVCVCVCVACKCVCGYLVSRTKQMLVITVLSSSTMLERDIACRLRVRLSFRPSVRHTMVLAQH